MFLNKWYLQHPYALTKIKLKGENDMKRLTHKLLSLLMSLCMVATICASLAVSSSAETPKFKGYTILGDSITAGMGIKKSSNWDKNLPHSGVIDYDVLQGMVNVPEGYYGVDEIEAIRQMSGGVTYRIHNSYPDLVGKAIGIKQKNDSPKAYQKLEKSGYYNLALPGVRSSEIRAILDPSFKGDQYTAEILGITNPNGYENLHAKAVEYIQNSELVTIACGSNDIALNCLIRSLHVIEDYSFYDDLEAQVLSMYANGQYAEATRAIALVARTLGHAAPAAAAYLEGLLTGTTMFFDNWDPIITAIHNINPNAKIVAVGFYNPFKSYALNDFGDENLLKVGHALDALLGTLDLYITNLASTRGFYTYANIWDTDVIGLMPILPNLVGDTYFKTLLFNVHPSNKGARYIADQIIKALSGDSTVQQLSNPMNMLKLNYNGVSMDVGEGGSAYTNAYIGSANEGDYIRVFYAPNEGRTLKSVKVTDALGNNVEVINYMPGQAQFVMPNGPVTVHVTFK